MKQNRYQAFAKINWSLIVTGRRPDGYHLLDMLMQPVSLCDELVLDESSEISLTVSGNAVPPGEDNLVLRAARALSPYSGGRGVRMTLIKRIPSGAGLGGGSADAACALKALNDWWDLHLEEAALARIGLSLGADVPFCLYGKPARVRGIGEDIEPLAFHKPADLVLIKPKQSLSTPSVFRAYDGLSHSSGPSLTEEGARALQRGDYGTLDRYLSNDLYPAALTILPELSALLSALREKGALFTAMSGSGSAVFGVFADEKSAASAGRALAYSLADAAVLPTRTLL